MAEQDNPPAVEVGEPPVPIDPDSMASEIDEATYQPTAVTSDAKSASAATADVVKLASAADAIGSNAPDRAANSSTQNETWEGRADDDEYQEEEVGASNT